MTMPGPGHERVTTDSRADDPVYDTFFMVGWPRLVRLAGRNPLVRSSDRVDALILVLTVMVLILAAPVAAAVGNAIHDTRRQAYAEQAASRQLVTATITDRYAAQGDSPTDTITVGARWSAAGLDHTGTVQAAPSIEPGDTVDIWVDGDGSPTDAPASPTRAAAEAVSIASATWLGVTSAAAAVYVGSRITLDRIRDRGWQHDIDNLAGDGEGSRDRP